MSGFDGELDKAMERHYRRNEDMIAWIEDHKEELIEEYADKHGIEEAHADWPMEEIAKLNSWAVGKFQEELRGLI